jgi:hypothetical protein
MMSIGFEYKEKKSGCPCRFTSSGAKKAVVRLNG